MELKAKNILILLLFKHVILHCESLLQEYCDADDEDCQHSNNDLKIGQLKHGKSQHMNILRRIRNKSLMECAKECLLTSQCKAINYRKNWKLCDALGERPDDEAIQVESGSVYSDISTWPKALAGKCADYNCANGKKCIIKTNGVPSCKHAYCKDEPPETPFAVSTETFGVYANLEAGNQYKCINNSYDLVGKPFVICDKKSKKWKKLFCCVEKPYRPRYCSDLPRHCDSGTYKIYPGNSTGFNIYCDNRKAWWNVIQRRKDGSVNFYRNWTEYEEGFGDLSTEFWLGNRLISQLTLSGNYNLRVRMKNQEQGWKNATYNGFIIGNATTGYKFQVTNFRGGDAGDSISSGSSNLINNGMKFSTYDRDNDNHASDNCAEKYKGAWWFNACYMSHLNGEYDQNLTHPFGIQWKTFPGTVSSSIMEIRRTG
ncbi:Fibrinogen gamma chain,Ryncolin-4,Fibrinogen-like protein A,Ficolin-1-A [Mytilus edulis]|uniref:Fibrinogen gamma chain,Ryncolin-4,Fibrinogen-like protein A,Ficolin-1-A n=1 Tax=Mytilus edulis TaxID=6550 RepID=A0A8S3SSX5_MYTED|nr:Fibrinogen gamma chain,Ryncolin-4,Fibrinogen-like protein A,Ficolin-1-A [Mytilus edulis]